MKKAKWLSEEALQIAVKRREVKSKGEKERYKHLNSEFQRIAKRDKKAFLSDLCKDIEENNRMGKTRDLFKKIRDTKGTFHAKMGLIKAFLSLLAILWNSAFRCLYLSFSSLLFTSLLFTAICKASSDSHFLFCISFSWGWS